jgi:hypothetical protein
MLIVMVSEGWGVGKEEGRNHYQDRYIVFPLHFEVKIVLKK